MPPALRQPQLPLVSSELVIEMCIRDSAMAVLAFIAVLPEYAVDLYFASTAASKPEYAQYAAANMTGSNRLLIGVGWSVVALCSVYAALRKRDPNAPKDPSPGVTLGEGHGIDLTILCIACLLYTSRCV